jgi:geranylgeranyl pyrophosphate synthase
VNNIDPKLSEAIKSGQENINNFLTSYFKELKKSQTYSGQKRLCDAMEYSILNGGKRFRALLVYWSGHAVSLDTKALNHIAGSMEMVHAFSLVHDDLPAMDDDDLRRGKPTCHIAFGQATAILAGDALLSEAFALLCKTPVNNHLNLLNLIQYFSKAIGPSGMVAGQSMDVDHKDIKDIDDLNKLHQLKTGELIQASALMPLILVGTKEDSPLFKALLEYSQALGIAFQIKDDLLDLTGDPITCGKNTQKDSSQNKVTYATLLNLERCYKELNKQTQTACEAIDNAIKHIKNFENSGNYDLNGFSMLSMLAKWNLNRNN